MYHQATVNHNILHV